ncbi:cupin domain-containing protein [Chamaesiphon minutus]|uniref:Cupin domain-containing protein n=1 Tax=Chamaesiphon minutus (strain ATCC 27169 / PCC 6605) TaxID=1173020 RepID=K9UCT1_CHAP6|nr:cupin domain-containing protein [Chamaesiphon minutus]AFY92019.1 cupin domain-containing protein [Chamaesiphon minutus PCC 6605]
MDTERIFKSARFLQPNDREPIRSVITTSPHATVVAWYVLPQQEIPAHQHPEGQDTWTILSGQGEYYLDRAGTTKSIVIGDVVIAPAGAVHGVYNDSDEPLIFISIVAPSDAGYELVDRL